MIEKVYCYASRCFARVWVFCCDGLERKASSSCAMIWKRNESWAHVKSPRRRTTIWCTNYSSSCLSLLLKRKLLTKVCSTRKRREKGCGASLFCRDSVLVGSHKTRILDSFTLMTSVHWHVSSAEKKGALKFWSGNNEDTKLPMVSSAEVVAHIIEHVRELMRHERSHNFCDWFSVSPLSWQKSSSPLNRQSSIEAAAKLPCEWISSQGHL